MNIGIDIDDTISNTFEYSYPVSKEYTKNVLNRNVKNLENFSFNGHKYLQAINEWNLEEENIFWDKYYKKIIQNVLPKQDAVEILKKLKKDGNKIYIITARYLAIDFDVKLETQNWLKKYGISYDELIIDSEKKGDIAQNKEIDIFIDDSYTNCLDVSNKGIKTFLMNSILNKNIEIENENIKRIFSWQEFYDEISYI